MEGNGGDPVIPGVILRLIGPRRNRLSAGAENLQTRARFGVFAATSLLLAAAGCGLPGPPQPPSLDLPAAAKDVRAERVGDTVQLSWTNPKENTDRTPIRVAVTAEICRELKPGTCEPAGKAPAAVATQQSYTDTLPEALRSGPPRLIAYRVRLLNARGASADLSEAARTVAGAAPPAIEHIQAQVIADGVLLRWQLNAPASPDTQYRLYRHQNGVQGKTSPDVTLEAAAAAPGAQQQAEDRSAQRGAHYEYRVQAVLRQRLEDAGGAHYIDVLGPESAPESIGTEGAFPPAAPVGLVAVGNITPAGPAIDLSWEPAPGAIAGYVVYRAQRAAGAAAAATPEQAAPRQPGTSFHDPGVQSGAEYIYTVVAVDAEGARSQPSTPVTETAPSPF